MKATFYREVYDEEYHVIDRREAVKVELDDKYKPIFDTFKNFTLSAHEHDVSRNPYNHKMKLAISTTVGKGSNVSAISTDWSAEYPMMSFRYSIRGPEGMYFHSNTKDYPRSTLTRDVQIHGETFLPFTDELNQMTVSKIPEDILKFRPEFVRKELVRLGTELIDSFVANDGVRKLFDAIGDKLLLWLSKVEDDRRLFDEVSKMLKENWKEKDQPIMDYDKAFFKEKSRRDREQLNQYFGKPRRFHLVADLATLNNLDWTVYDVIDRDAPSKVFDTREEAVDYIRERLRILNIKE